MYIPLGTEARGVLIQACRVEEQCHVVRQKGW